MFLQELAGTYRSLYIEAQLVETLYERQRFLLILIGQRHDDRSRIS